MGIGTPPPDVYRSVFEDLADAVLVLDQSGRSLYSNRQAIKLCGIPKDELQTTGILPHLDVADRHVLSNALQSRQSLSDTDIALWIPTPDRSDKVLLSIRIAPLADRDDLMVVALRDVTEERMTAKALAEASAFLQRIIDNSPDAIIVANRSGVLQLFNRSAERILGYTSEEAVGKLNARALYPAGGAERIMRLVRAKDFGGTGRLEAYATELLARDGSTIPVMLSAALLMEGSEDRGSVGVFTDLREKVQMRAQLAAIQEELRVRERDLMIAQLAGAAAHELNQPLQTILGYAELLRQKVPAGTDFARAVDNVSKGAERMAAIVQRIAKLPRYETVPYEGGAEILDLQRSGDPP